jgi:hypothetical protein
MYDNNNYCKLWREKHPESVKAANKRIHLKYKNMMRKLKSNGCAICGYNKCQSALSFHHVEACLKLFRVNDYTIQRKCTNQEIADEIAKCILLCENCHREIHENEGKVNEL